LVIVKVKVEVPPARIGLDENNFEIAGGLNTVKVALAEPDEPVFVPLSLVCMNPLTLSCTPVVEAVTFTLTVQELLAGIVPPEKERLVAPAVGVVPINPQVVLYAGVAATC
jgi:hypothetical protein